MTFWAIHEGLPVRWLGIPLILQALVLLTDVPIVHNLMYTASQWIVYRCDQQRTFYIEIKQIH